MSNNRDLRVQSSFKITDDSQAALNSLPLATIGEIRFKSEAALRRYRSQIYGINKDNAAGYRYRSERSTRSTLTLYVWRMN